MGVERVFLTVILNEVLMTSTDFMEEKEVFELLGKKKQQYGVYVKIIISQIQFSLILLDIAEKLCFNGLKMVGLVVAIVRIKSHPILGGIKIISDAMQANHFQKVPPLKIISPQETND